MSSSQSPDTKNATPEASLDSPIEIDVGYQEEQEPQKPFTMLSAASLGYSICNTPVATLLVTGNDVFGGAPVFFYGTLLIILVSISVAISLGELASAYPHAGGQYFYVAKLSPPKYRRYASYMTGIISWASIVCIGASSCSGATGVAFELAAIKHPNFEYQRWQGFLVFQAANIAAFSFNLFERFIPKLGKMFMCLSIVTGLGFFCTLLAANSPKQNAHGFFAEYYNTSGWPDGVAFFIGVSGINWGFSCLDAVTHLSEEIPAPRKNVPTALLTTVAIGAVTGLSIIFAIFFAAYDLSNTSSAIQLLRHIYNGNPIPALILGSILLTSTWASLIGIHTWQARVAWSLSRDKGFPFNRHLSRLAPEPFSVPLWAHVWSTAWISLCGFLYLASLTAFNSFVSAGIVLQYLTYSVPVVFLLLKGRKNFAHGPFFWPKLGFAANILLLCWTLITLVFYCFPLYLQAVAGEMNYLSVVLVLAFFYALAYWVAYGNKHYKLVDLQVILD